jgi:hypothetical protein
VFVELTIHSLCNALVDWCSGAANRPWKHNLRFEFKLPSSTDKFGDPNLANLIKMALHFVDVVHEQIENTRTYRLQLVENV